MKGRYFRLSDGMILVAATAVGMALLMAHLRSLKIWRMYQSPFHFIPTYYDHWCRFTESISGASLLLAVWSVADLIFFGIRPRPGCRRLGRSPGFVTCLATVLGLTLWVLSYGWELWSSMMEEPFLMHLWMYMARIPCVVGPCVASAWLGLILAGRWRRRPDQDWRDRAGRVLGWCWLALYALVEIP